MFFNILPNRAAIVKLLRSIPVRWRCFHASRILAVALRADDHGFHRTPNFEMEPFLAVCGLFQIKEIVRQIRYIYYLMCIY
jgi:hypothetical protein